MNDASELTARARRLSALPTISPVQPTTAVSAGLTAGDARRAHAAAGRSGHAVRDKERHRGHAGAIAAGVIAAMLAATYGAGAFAFSRIYYPGTDIAGVDVSLMSKDAAVGRVNASVQGYGLKVTGGDFSWSYQPSEDSVVVDADARAQEVLDGNDFLAWPVELYRSVTGTREAVAPATTDANGDAVLPQGFDEQAFDQQLTQAVDAYNAGRTGEFTAQAAYDESTGTFSAERALANVKIDKDQVAKAAKLAIAELSTTAEVPASAFGELSGKYTDAQVKEACDAANQLIGTNCVIDMEGNQVATLDGKTLASFITFDDALKPTLSTDALTAWAKDLGAKLNTVGTQRTYTRPDGKQITVDGGTFGWTVDTAALVKSVQDAVANKQTDPIAIPTSTKGDTFTAAGQKDWGSYIDVDLTEQHARYYDANGNLLWESGCITGKPSGGNDTPTGVWKTNSVSKKNVSTMLRGPKKDDGTYEWESPVAVWIPFIRNSYGLHDATWQREANFSNPDAYKTVGSHGCVNLPLDKAEELRDMLDGTKGLAVVVHW